MDNSRYDYRYKGKIFQFILIEIKFSLALCANLSLYYKQNESIISSTLVDITIPINSEFYWLDYDVSSTFNIIQMYTASATATMIMENVGRIVDNEFIDFRSTRIVSERRKNLLGMHFKASMVVTNNDTLNHLTDYR